MSSRAGKPNVLLLLNSFETGGAEGQLVLLARLLIESRRFGVHLACLGRTGPLLAPGHIQALCVRRLQKANPS